MCARNLSPLSLQPNSKSVFQQVPCTSRVAQTVLCCSPRRGKRLDRCGPHAKQPMKVAACTSRVDSHHIRVCFKQALPGGQEPHLVYDAWHIFGASVMYLEQK